MRVRDRLDEIIATLASVSLALLSLKDSASFWEHNKWLLLVLVGVILLFILVSPFDRIADNRTRWSYDAASRIMLDLLVKTSKESGISENDIVVHLWKVYSPIKRGYRRTVMRMYHLRTNYEQRVRLIDFPLGHGVVGLCAKHKVPQTKDVANDFGSVKSEADWAALAQARGEDFTMHLNYEIYQQTSHRGAVMASPIIKDNRRCVGVISIDTPGDASKLFTCMGLLNEAAGHLQDLGLEQLR
jgi:hypothetical protein